MRMQDIMTSKVETIAPDLSCDGALEKMRQAEIRHLVVTDRSGIVGVLSQRDIGGKSGVAVRNGRRASDLMSGRPVTVSPRTTVRQAANLLRGRNIGCLPVVDEGKLVGIVTITDMLDLLGRGMQKPVEESKRWTVRSRGPRRGSTARG
jgi:acetoin utilization protein AcuB